MTSIYIGLNFSNTELLGYICFNNAECVCCLRHHNPYVRLWLKSTSVKVMMSCSWHAWRLGFAAPLIYKPAAPLLSVPVVTRPLSEGTVWWTRSEHGRAARAVITAEAFGVVFRVGFLQMCSDYIHIQSVHNDWSRAISVGLKRGGTLPGDCLFQLFWSAVSDSTSFCFSPVIEENWMTKKKCITAELLSLYDRALRARACYGVTLYNILRTKPAS